MGGWRLLPPTPKRNNSREILPTFAHDIRKIASSGTAAGEVLLGESHGGVIVGYTPCQPWYRNRERRPCIHKGTRAIYRRRRSIVHPIRQVRVGTCGGIPCKRCRLGCVARHRDGNIGKWRPPASVPELYGKLMGCSRSKSRHRHTLQ